MNYSCSIPLYASLNNRIKYFIKFVPHANLGVREFVIFTERANKKHYAEKR